MEQAMAVKGIKAIFKYEVAFRGKQVKIAVAFSMQQYNWNYHFGKWKLMKGDFNEE